jgi:hypothetical protein
MADIDALAVAALTRHLDALVGACLDANQKPKAPDYRTLMAARGALPPTAKHAFGSSSTGDKSE